jgi:hypothetical protein
MKAPEPKVIGLHLLSNVDRRDVDVQALTDHLLDISLDNLNAEARNSAETVRSDIHGCCTFTFGLASEGPTLMFGRARGGKRTPIWQKTIFVLPYVSPLDVDRDFRRPEDHPPVRVVMAEGLKGQVSDPRHIVVTPVEVSDLGDLT